MAPVVVALEGGDGTIVTGEPSNASAINDNGKAEPEKVDSGQRGSFSMTPVGRRCDLNGAGTSSSTSFTSSSSTVSMLEKRKLPEPPPPDFQLPVVTIALIVTLLLELAINE